MRRPNLNGRDAIGVGGSDEEIEHVVVGGGVMRGGGYVLTQTDDNRTTRATARRRSISGRDSWSRRTWCRYHWCHQPSWVDPRARRRIRKKWSEMAGGIDVLDHQWLICRTVLRQHSISTAADIRTSGSRSSAGADVASPSVRSDVRIWSTAPRLDFDVWLSGVERASRGIHRERNPDLSHLDRPCKSRFRKSPERRDDAMWSAPVSVVL